MRLITFEMNISGDESILLVNLDDAEVHRIDQSSRAQEPKVAIADPPEPNSTTSPDGTLSSATIFIII